MAMTEAQRKAKDAARKRASRAAARKAELAAAAAAKDVRTASAPSVMRTAVTKSLAAMKWLSPSDSAAVQQAKMLAKQVDELEHAGDTTRALSAHRALTTILDRLGGTPTVRMQHELRSLRAAAKTEVPDGVDGDEGKPASNVSKFERPAKRRPG